MISSFYHLHLVIITIRITKTILVPLVSFFKEAFQFVSTFNSGETILATFEFKLHYSLVLEL